GGDGFTPIGPKAIDTAGIGEGDWRVRTWVNGDLVQADTTDTLKFSFGQLVADLSQHMTLDTGHVILTATPAGPSVLVPGHTVAVEVDAPQAPGAPTTGRLVTAVTQGTHAFGDFGNKPKATDLQRIEAWGSEEEHAEAVAAGRANPLDAEPHPLNDE